MVECKSVFPPISPSPQDQIAIEAPSVFSAMFEEVLTSATRPHQYMRSGSATTANATAMIYGAISTYTTRTAIVIWSTI